MPISISRRIFARMIPPSNRSGNVESELLWMWPIATSPSSWLEVVLDDVGAHLPAECLALLCGEAEVDAGSHARVGVLVGRLGEGVERADGVRWQRRG